MKKQKTILKKNFIQLLTIMGVFVFGLFYTNNSYGQENYTLTTTSDKGDIVFSPDTSSTGYAPGTAVTLTATPDADHTFTGWSGDIQTSDNPVTITMDGDMDITANYIADSLISAFGVNFKGDAVTVDGIYYMSVGKGDWGGATSEDITGVENDIIFQSWRLGNLSYDFPAVSGVYDVTVMLTEGWATANRTTEIVIEGLSLDTVPTGAKFEAIERTFRLVLTDGVFDMDFNTLKDNAAVCGIKFEKLEGVSTYTLTTVGTNGNLEIFPKWDLYADGAEVKITATTTSTSGYEFVDFTGDTTSTDSNIATIIMDADKSVTANFAAVPTYDVTITQPFGGTISLDPAGGTYNEGTEVTASISRDIGFDFIAWTSSISGFTESVTFTMDEDKAISAQLKELVGYYSEVVAAINCGGDEYTAADGTVYEADNYFEGGGTYSNYNFDFVSEDKYLYQSLRNAGGFNDPNPFTYKIPVENGTYEVTLKFGDDFRGGANKRMMDVSIEDELVLPDFDIRTYTGTGGDNKVKVVDTVFTVKVTDGELTILVETSALSEADVALLNAFKVNTISFGTKSVVYAVNSGGNEYMHSEGTLFEADNYVSGGNTASTSNEIANTENDPLYQTERWGGDTKYDFPLEEGFYDVTLYFAETYGNVGERVFNTFIEGAEVISDLNLVEYTGDKFVAFDTTFRVKVIDGELNVSFENIKDNAKISAIKVEALSLWIWRESFMGIEDNATTDDGVSAWTSSSTSTGFSVQGGEFVNNGDNGTFTTEYIQNPGGHSVDITLSVSSSAGVTDPADYIQLYVKSNEEPKVLADEIFGAIDGIVQLEALDVSGDSIQIIIESNVTDNAEFMYWDELFVSITDNMYALNVNETVGSVAITPGGGVYNPGTEVTLVADVTPGYAFDSWSGDTISTKDTIIIAMDSIINITANYAALDTFKLMVEAENATLRLDPGSVLGDSLFYDGDVVEISTKEFFGYEFIEWTGDFADSTNSTLLVTMDQDYTAKAIFAKIPFFTITTNDTAGSDINGSVFIEPIADSFERGTEVSISANPDAGYRFVEWTGDISSTDFGFTVTIESDLNLTAHFELIPEQYGIVTTSENGSITLDPVPVNDTYDAGTLVTITAVAEDGYIFNGWAGDLDGSEISTTVTVDSNIAITALFEEIVGVNDVLAQKTKLSQNYPNPFATSTIIPYELSESTHVDLSIYNFLGQKVATLVSEHQTPGSYEVEWVAKDLSNGIYFYRLETGEESVQIKKTILTR